MKKGKIRLDQLLVERGLVSDLDRAQAMIIAGLVFQGEQCLSKPGYAVVTTAKISVRGHDHPWVSRGGIKLAHGLACFGIKPHDLVALDIGVSTGGFTDVLLAGGVRRVYAVDVGYGQLSMRLRRDSRVVVLERTNARFLSSNQITEPVGILVCDASFIGLQAVLPAPMSLTCPGAYLVALIKPQFEVGRNLVCNRGIVRDPLLQSEVCDKIIRWISSQPNWHVLGVVESPIKGAGGNQEFLIGAVRIDY